MQQNPSLLDWLRVKLGHPRNQRFLRFGLAVLAAVWGAYSLLFLGKPGVGGYFFLGLALGVPWLILALSLAAAAIGVVLFTGIPNPKVKREAGQPPPQPLLQN